MQINDKQPFLGYQLYTYLLLMLAFAACDSPATPITLSETAVLPS